MEPMEELQMFHIIEVLLKCILAFIVYKLLIKTHPEHAITLAILILEL